MRDYDRLLSIPFASLVARYPVPCFPFLRSLTYGESRVSAWGSLSQPAAPYYRQLMQGGRRLSQVPELPLFDACPAL